MFVSNALQQVATNKQLSSVDGNKSTRNTLNTQNGMSIANVANNSDTYSKNVQIADKLKVSYASVVPGNYKVNLGLSEKQLQNSENKPVEQAGNNKKGFSVDDYQRIKLQDNGFFNVSPSKSDASKVQAYKASSIEKSIERANVLSSSFDNNI